MEAVEEMLSIAERVSITTCFSLQIIYHWRFPSLVTGVVARGCFAPSANSSVGNVTVRISQNYTSLVETLLDTQTVCFELHFILEETGNLTLTLTAVEVAADSNANTLCNGSLPVTVEVLPCTLRSLPVTPRLLYLSDVSHGLCLEDAWIGTVLQGR